MKMAIKLTIKSVMTSSIDLSKCIYFMDVNLPLPWHYAATASMSYLHRTPTCMTWNVVDTANDLNDVVKIYEGLSIEHLRIIKQMHDRRKSKHNGLDNSSTQIKRSDTTHQLAVRRPFFEHKNFFENHSLQYGKNIQTYLLKFVEKIFRAESLYFYSYENIFFNCTTEQFIFNPTSTTGFRSVLAKKGFPLAQFQELYELLNIRMFDKGLRSFFIYKLKFRAIAMFIKDMIFHQRKPLLKMQTDIKQDFITFQNAKLLVQKRVRRFRQFLNYNNALAIIADQQQKDKANYLVFLRRVFEDDCQDLEWKQVVSLLFNPYKSNADEKLRDLMWRLSSSLFRKEDQNSKKELIRLGLAKTVGDQDEHERQQPKIILIDEDNYLHYHLLTASFTSASVADQIYQQKQGNGQDPIRFEQILVLIQNCSGIVLANPVLFQIKSTPKKFKSKSRIQEPNENSKLLSIGTEAEYDQAYDLINGALQSFHSKSSEQPELFKKDDHRSKFFFAQEIRPYLQEESTI